MSDYFLRAKLFKTKKRLGQNFLVDESVINRITDEVQPDDTVLEIGPGAGFVTENIVNKSKHVHVFHLFFIYLQCFFKAEVNKLDLIILR